MAEKTTRKSPREHTFVSASGVAATSQPPQAKPAAPKGNPTALRVGAAVAWVIAIALEVVAVLTVKQVIPAQGALFWVLLIGALALDLVGVVVGSQLWKKANRIKPASKANKVKFWLWNNLGVLVSVVAFAPFVVLLLTDKNADGKTKTIGSVVAVAALLIAGVSSYDFDPVSQEDLDAATGAYGAASVYWTAHGSVYHSHDDCYSLDRTDELTYGTVDQAIAAGRQRLCKICAKRDEEAGLDLDGVLTEPGEVSDSELKEVSPGGELPEPQELTPLEPAA